MKIEPSALRARIATDHAVLRGLFRALVVAARTTNRDDKQRTNVKDLLAQLMDEVERHFAFEEEVLGPLMSVDSPWQTVRLDRLVREHTEQRTLLVTLSKEAEDGLRDIDDLADEIAWLFYCFEVDMAEEERRLVGAKSDGVPPRIDQIDA